MTQGSSTTEYTTTLTIEGTYTITASAVGLDSQTYSDTVTITVFSKSQLGNLLTAKWEGLKAKIAANDVESAVAYFVKALQPDIREEFTAAGTSLPLLVNELTSLDIVYITDNLAKCHMIRSEELLGQIIQFEYPIYYIKEDGIWKLQNL